MNSIRTCKKCVMPENYPDISFNKEGVCNICSKDKPEITTNWQTQKELFEEKINEIKNEATNYHAVVPWSGGKDSTYVIYVLTQVYNLKVLAINFDNGFQSELAYENIKNIRQKIGFDIITIKPNPSLMNRLFKHYLKAKGELCSVCNVVRYVMIFSYIFREHASLGYMPLIVDGLVKHKDESRPFFTYDYSEFKDIVSSDPELFKSFEENLFVNKNVCTLLEKIGDVRELGEQLDLQNSSKFIHLSEYLEWDIENIKLTLRSKLNWVSSRAPIVAHEDCKWHKSMEHLLLKNYNINHDALHLSTEIRAGRLSRDKALTLLRDHSKVPSDIIEHLSNVGCSPDELYSSQKDYNEEEDYSTSFVSI